MAREDLPGVEFGSAEAEKPAGGTRGRRAAPRKPRRASPAAAAHVTAEPDAAAPDGPSRRETLLAEQRRGRGALSNPAGRFEPVSATHAPDDGFDEWPPRSVPTEIAFERPKSIITRNDSPDLSFDRSINPFRGCEHGCVYCFARPTHAFLGLSPGLDFETKLTVKLDADARLERELAAPSYRPRTIALGTNTDPYQPIERRHGVTRRILEVLARADHPVGIVTKSALVTRDIDLLAPMAAKGLAKVALSVTTLDGGLARTLEPRASAPLRRLAAIRSLAAAGIPVSVMVAPLIPAVNDAEIEAILEAARAAGAGEAGYVILRLPLEVRDLFREWLLAHAPDKLRHVMSLIQSMREGKDYDSSWGKRMTGTGPYALMLGRRFEIAAARLGYARTRAKLRTDLFRPPVPPGGQLDLFAR